jgi:hypothetical protein
MFSFWSVIYVIALIAISLLMLWLIVYSAVRAALTSHRRAMAEEAGRASAHGS